MTKVNLQDVSKLFKLKKGDVVVIESQGFLKKPRKVTVLSPREKLGRGIMVQVSSGNVRSRHRSGGIIEYKPELGKTPEELFYQPTLQQRPVPITKITVLPSDSAQMVMSSKKALLKLAKQCPELRKTLIQKL